VTETNVNSVPLSSLKNKLNGSLCCRCGRATATTHIIRWHDHHQGLLATSHSPVQAVGT